MWGPCSLGTLRIVLVMDYANPSATSVQIKVLCKCVIHVCIQLSQQYLKGCVELLPY